MVMRRTTGAALLLPANLGAAQHALAILCARRQGSASVDALALPSYTVVGLIRGVRIDVTKRRGAELNGLSCSYCTVSDGARYAAIDSPSNMVSASTTLTPRYPLRSPSCAASSWAGEKGSTSCQILEPDSEWSGVEGRSGGRRRG